MNAHKSKNTQNSPSGGRKWRGLTRRIIFEADTPAGKLFDILLIVSILISVIVVMLNSVESIAASHKGLFTSAEWFFTLLFTMEYILRLICVGKPIRYAASFYGIVDLLAVIPTYISLLVPGTEAQSLLIIRSLRLLRVFRVLKLAQYISPARLLISALRASSRKIIVFLFAVLAIAAILGSIMYVIEGRQANTGFTSIPKSVYWAIVTLTTVGYGDISPQTAAGQALAAIIMILGYSIIAIPTGIVSVEVARGMKDEPNLSTRSCPDCSTQDHDEDAKFCKSCGAKL